MIKFKRLPGDIYKKINQLKDLFSEDPNIIFAYLFGGLLKKRPGPFSDIDIAVYVKDMKKLDYLFLFSSITNFLDTDELDLVILNSSPLSLTGRIVQNRNVIIDKNPFLRHKYESAVLRKYFDFQVKERSIIKRRYGFG
jgi:predicted nucleotidyltransferase